MTLLFFYKIFTTGSSNVEYSTISGKRILIDLMVILEKKNYLSIFCGTFLTCQTLFPLIQRQKRIEEYFIVLKILRNNIKKNHFHVLGENSYVKPENLIFSNELHHEREKIYFLNIFIKPSTLF